MVTFPKKEQQFQDMSQRKNRLWLGPGGGGCSRHLGKLRAGRKGCNPGTNFFLAVAHLVNRRKLKEGKALPGRLGMLTTVAIPGG